MDHNEVVQACIEWARNHFGVEVSSSVTLQQSMRGYVSAEFQVKKPDNVVPDDKT